jgi:hypothetical protein
MDIKNPTLSDGLTLPDDLDPTRLHIYYRPLPCPHGGDCLGEARLFGRRICTNSQEADAAGAGRPRRDVSRPPPEQQEKIERDMLQAAMPVTLEPQPLPHTLAGLCR